MEEEQVNRCVSLGEERAASQTSRGGAHLTGVKPIVKLLLALDAGQDEAVEDVLAHRCEQRATEANAEQNKETGEVVDSHLQRLGRKRVTCRFSNVQAQKTERPFLCLSER